MGSLLGKTGTGPAYKVEAQGNNYQIRRYDAMVMATTMALTQEEAFDRLQAFFSAQGLPMSSFVAATPTTPVKEANVAPSGEVTEVDTSITKSVRDASGAVVSQEHAEFDVKEKQFITRPVRLMVPLPLKFKTKEQTPTPTDPRIQIEVIPERVLVVGSIMGGYTVDNVDAKVADLRSQLAQDGVKTEEKWWLVPCSSYWTPSPLRSSEIMLEISSVQQQAEG